MKFVAIIPARYASTRFEGKPLADIMGKPMIQHVYEQVSKVINEVYVATDDERIANAVANFGGKAIMTSIEHKSGTDRCYEAFCKSGSTADVIVNIQGDEPFIQPEQIERIMECFHKTPETQIATLAKAFTLEDTFDELFDANTVKLIFAPKTMRAIYFSRSIVPYSRNLHHTQWLNGDTTYYRHIGMYAYKADVLGEITQLPQSALELAESLEQLRWIENGYNITVGISEQESMGIDTPEDLENAIAKLKASAK